MSKPLSQHGFHSDSTFPDRKLTQPAAGEKATGGKDRVQDERVDPSAFGLGPAKSIKLLVDVCRKSTQPASTDPHHQPLRGIEIGDFQILREIGRGGMGFVFEAMQLSLNRRVGAEDLASGIGAQVSMSGTLREGSPSCGLPGTSAYCSRLYAGRGPRHLLLGDAIYPGARSGPLCW